MADSYLDTETVTVNTETVTVDTELVDSDTESVDSYNYDTLYNKAFSVCVMPKWLSNISEDKIESIEEHMFSLERLMSGLKEYVMELKNAKSSKVIAE